MVQRKIKRSSPERSDLFDGLPDDILLSILCKLSSTARCPSDFITILLTCKRLNRLGVHPLVLSKTGSKALAIRAKNWSEQAHRFLKRCVAAGSVEACYTLGMIRFYCLQNRASGASLMAKAAIRSHAPSLYSLAVIQFNGSGGSKTSRDLHAGVALCGRAAYLGHVDAIRELGHCLQDGYGVSRDVAEGRRLLVRAAARELASALRAASPTALRSILCQLKSKTPQRNSNSLSLLNEFGFNILSVGGEYRIKESDVSLLSVASSMETHPVNRFMNEWFGSGSGSGSLDSDSGNGTRMCSNSGCGRPETRRNEFRRCSACGAVNYCSRACQAQDWKMRHKGECLPVAVDHPIVMNLDGGAAVPLVMNHHLDGGDEVLEDDRTGEVGGGPGE